MTGLSRLLVLLLFASLTIVLPSPLPAAAGGAMVGGLSVSVGYAEDKENNNPDPAAFPVPWAGAPNTTFLGSPVPGQAACGTLMICYDTGAIRFDNPGSSDVAVGRVSVDIHSSVPGGMVFDNLWGPFTVAAGKSVILAANPPFNNPTYDNFDTSGFPNNNCTPVTVAPTVTVTIAGVATTLADSTHVLDTGGIDAGYCPPKQNESIPWRQIGAAGGKSVSLTLAPTTLTRFAGQPVTETATLLDGGGAGLPNATVAFSVTSGPNSGRTGSAVTDLNGHAAFTYPDSASGEDVVAATVTTTVGTISSNQARVMWTNDSTAGWSSGDIGTATPAGSDSLNTASGTWTIQGGGSDISGTADQFHFVWQTLSGGGGVAARVISQTNTNAVAKAGVMLRQTNDPGSAYYAVLVTPGNGIVVQDRATLGGATSVVASQTGAAPSYLWVANSGNTYAAYGSSDGYIWNLIPGSTVTVNLGSTLLAGLAVTSHNTSALSTAAVDTVAVTASPPPPTPPIPCPSPWTCADIGGPTPAGSQAFDPNTAAWTINAGGADITGAADQFRFVWQTLSGDGSISAHVTSQTNTSIYAKAGVMFRQTADPASPNYAVLVSPGAGIKVQVRTVQGGTTTKLANPTGTVPAYLKVTTAGGNFGAYTSPDGVTWTLIPGSTVTMNLGSTMLAGLAVTSHNTGSLGTVTMDSVAEIAVVVAPPATNSAVSTSQYTLANSDGSTWQEIDPTKLRLTASPTADQSTLLSANVDLWTYQAGFNQDIGIFAADNTGADTLVSWKESGGGAGTFSPNAAFVQGLYAMTAGHTYVFKLKWKTNSPDAGTISAGAGPISGVFSPTSLTAETFPVGITPNYAVSTAQYSLTGSDGAAWQSIDPVNLATTLSPASNGTAELGANVDLWTYQSGHNQDIGIWVSDNGGVDALVSWKESGGNGGAFSPNAAYVKATYPVVAGHTYAFKLKWKTNSADAGTIAAGAGPISGAFSPSSLFAYIPGGGNLQSSVSTSQYSLTGSDGTTWQPLDAALNVTVTPTADINSILDANVDLWTYQSGHNQDLGLFIQDNSLPDALVAWKESGGNAGTFSPNAAAIQAAYQLTAGHTYVFKLKWKTNNADAGTIAAGAGPISGAFSPTRLTVELTNPGPSRGSLIYSASWVASGFDVTGGTIDFTGSEAVCHATTRTEAQTKSALGAPTPFWAEIDMFAAQSASMFAGWYVEGDSGQNRHFHFDFLAENVQIKNGFNAPVGPILSLPGIGSGTPIHLAAIVQSPRYRLVQNGAVVYDYTDPNPPTAPGKYGFDCANNQGTTGLLHVTGLRLYTAN